MAKKRFPHRFWPFQDTRNSRRIKLEYRRARIELLEPRLTLSVQLGILPDSLTVLAGAPLNVALNGVDASLGPTSPPPFYTFGTPVISNFNLSNPSVSASQLQANLASVLDPATDQSMKIKVSDTPDGINGTMTLQLFEDLAPNTTGRIIALANGTASGLNGPFYDGLIFHRVINGFMIQGGDPSGNGTGGSGTKFDDEFNPQLQFTSSGILAMANSGPDSNDSQFFITDTPANNPYRSGDFKYTIFGFLTSGYDVLNQIESVPTTAADKPVNNVTMTSVTIAPDGANRTLRLAVPKGTTGTVDLTVSLDPPWDGSGTQPAPLTHTFHITIAADTNTDPPFLNPIGTLRTTANTTLSYQVPATSVDGNAITYGGTVGSSNSNVVLTVNSSTGQTSIQTNNSWAGVATLNLSVTGAGASSPDTQAVPLIVNPAKPAVTLLASSDTGPSSSDDVTNPNLFTDSTKGTLAFNLSNLATGATVVLYVDGTPVGQGTASSDTMVVRTPTTFTWTEGLHTVTAKQTLNGANVTVGNASIPLGLASDTSDAVSIVIDTTAPQITSTAPLSVVRTQQYAYNVQSTDKAYDAQAGVATKVQYQVTAAPTGMQIGLTTGAITWTPGANAPTTAPVTVRAMDLAGNTVDQSFTIQVQDVNIAPVVNAQSLTAATATPKAIQLTGNDNNGGTQTLTYALATQPGHGTLSGFNAATGAVTYTSDASYTGADSFTVTVTDDGTAGPPGPLTSPPATISINVLPVNSPPTANAQNVSTNEDSTLAITLTGTDSNPGLNQVLTYSIVTQPSHGTLTGFDPATGAVTYTPGPAYVGTDSFTFRTTDDGKAEPPNLSSDPATVSITVNRVNHPPIAFPQTLTTNQDTPTPIVLTGDDGDPGVTQVLTFAVATGPSHGTLSGFDAATGAVTYTPAPNYSGADTFTFTVTDDGQAGPPANLTSPTAIVSLVVNRVNDPPQFAPIGSFTAIAGQTFQTTVHAVDPDISVSPIRYSLDPGSPPGATVDPQTGNLAFPVSQQTLGGTVQLTVRATKVSPAAPSATQAVDVTILPLAAALLRPTAPLPVTSPTFGLPAFASLALPGGLPAAPSFLPSNPPQFTFRPADLLDGPGFFTYSFGPDLGGNSGGGYVETPETNPTQGPQGPQTTPQGDTGGSNPASLQGTDSSKTSNQAGAGAVRRSRSGTSSPQLNDAAIEEWTGGGDSVDVPDQLVEAELLLASND